MVSARFVLPLMLSAAVRGEDTPDFADVADEEACEMQQTLLQVSKGVHKSRAASHTATVETVAGAYAQCPEKGHNGGCCHTCLTNRYCPADGGCYTAGDSRCPVELCPAPEDVPTPWYLKPGVFCGTSGLDVNGNKPADCSACHGMGHTKVNCPKCCTHCKALGHKAFVCPMKLQCYRCHAFGHKSIDCPTLCCYQCNAFGHRAIDCPKKLQRTHCGSDHRGSVRDAVTPKKDADEVSIASTSTVATKPDFLSLQKVCGFCGIKQTAPKSNKCKDRCQTCFRAF